MPTMHNVALLTEAGVLAPPPRGARADADVRAALEADIMAIDPSAIGTDGVRLSGMRAGWYDDDECPYEVVGSTAVVSIDGPLSQRGGWWYDGYEAIKVRYLAALKDERVSVVALKLNSPGGVCAGCFESARWMRAAKVAYGKPVMAFADEAAYSAAYALACVADEIWLPESGGVGSVGVLGSLMDATKMLQDMGLRVAVIGSGKAKGDGHPAKPLTEEIVERYRASVMHLAGIFASVVAESRGMTPAAVMALEAMCFDGQNAVKVGLANGVSSLGDFLRRCDAMARKQPSKAKAAHAAPSAPRARHQVQSRNGLASRR